VKPGERKKAGPSAMDQFAGTVARNGTKIGMVGLVIAVLLPFVTSNYLVDFGTNVLIYVMLGWGLNIVVASRDCSIWLRRVLRGRRLYGRSAGDECRAWLLGLPAARGPVRRHLRRRAGLSGPAAARRLPRHRDARLRRDHPRGAAELAGRDERPERHRRHPRPTLFGLPFVAHSSTGPTFAEFFGLEFSPASAWSSSISSSWAGAAHQLLHDPHAQAAGRPRLGSAARGRDRLPGDRHQRDQHQAVGLRHRRHVRRFAGSFFATRLGFISPESFTFTESATILAIVVLGGMGSQLGVVLAAIMLVSLNEAGRWFSFLGDIALYRPLIYGGAMVVIMLVRPRGLLAHRQPSILLHGPNGPKESLVPNEGLAASTGELP